MPRPTARGRPGPCWRPKKALPATGPFQAVVDWKGSGPRLIITSLKSSPEFQTPPSGRRPSASAILSEASPLTVEFLCGLDHPTIPYRRAGSCQGISYTAGGAG